MLSHFFTASQPFTFNCFRASLVFSFLPPTCSTTPLSVSSKSLSVITCRMCSTVLSA
ncbi:Uncharacterised protein [Mycobacteroides abscessus subsp. abscessus]|nr:Uncharacterised protein [Mycobacteroides abscessus subsp. abscessus]